MILPGECFDLHPATRLDKTRKYVALLSDGDRRRLYRRLKEDLTFPHCAYAIPAWGLMVLPGPGRDSLEIQRTEPYCDWTRGIGKASRHFSEFPNYIVSRREPMWQGMRSTISNVCLPGVESKDRFACWGLVNLTTEHVRSETVRRTKFWDLENYCWQVIEICRPALIIAPPSKMGGGRCFDRVRRFLNEKGAVPAGTMQRYRGDRGTRTWDFQWWNTPWGRCRIGKMHTQPAYWPGSRAIDILTEEARCIAAKGN